MYFMASRRLQGADVELRHAHQGGQDALRPAGVGQELRQDGGDDLPRQAEAVLEPAALLGRGVAAGPELLPVAVDLVLRGARDLERDGLVELEDRPAVEGG